MYSRVDRDPRDDGPAETQTVKKPSRPERTPHGRAQADRAGSRAEPEVERTPNWAARTSWGLMAASVALFVATTLIPCESATPLGTHVVIVMAWFLVALGCLARKWAQSRGRGGQGGMRPLATDWAVGLFVALHSLSAVLNLWSGQPRATLNGLWLGLAMGLLYGCLRLLATTSATQRAALTAWIALAVGLSAYGFYQVGYSYPQQRARYAEDPDRELQLAGIDAPLGTPQRRHFEDRLASIEPTGTFVLTNSLAGFLVPAIILLIGIGGAMWSTMPRDWKRLVAISGLLLVVAGCLLLTKSRSAYLAMAAGCAVLALSRIVPRAWLRWQSVVGVVVLLVIATAVAVQFGGLDRQVVTEAEKSLHYRLQYWQAATAMVSDYPWFGCGLGNFKSYYTHYKLPEASEEVADPHNFLLEIAATAGVPALVALWAVLVSLGIGRPMRSSRPADDTVTDDAWETSPSAVYAGLIGGFFLAFPAGWSGGFGPDLALLWTALPAACLALVCLHAWVEQGASSATLLAIALGTLLVNLLAAGGIGFPGVGQLLWWCLALLVNARAPAEPLIESNEGAERRGAVWQAGLALFLLILAIACYFTMYRPVLAAREKMTESRQARSEAASEASVLAAAAADPWWGEPWEILAQLYAEKWLASRDDRTMERFLTSIRAFRERDRAASRVERRCGDWFLEMYVQSRDVELGRQAVAAYEQAVAFYPNSGLMHAQLAWACFVTGDRERARQEAEKAAHLDQLMPHAELRLSQQRLTADEAAGSLESGHPQDHPRTAEQIVDFLRKTKDS